MSTLKDWGSKMPLLPTQLTGTTLLKQHMEKENIMKTEINLMNAIQDYIHDKLSYELNDKGIAADRTIISLQQSLKERSDSIEWLREQNLQFQETIALLDARLKHLEKEQVLQKKLLTDEIKDQKALFSEQIEMLCKFQDEQKELNDERMLSNENRFRDNNDWSAKVDSKLIDLEEELENQDNRIDAVEYDLPEDDVIAKIATNAAKKELDESNFILASDLTSAINDQLEPIETALEEAATAFKIKI